ncbi:hypothetical protein F2Q70_00036420 [Brassica cretica]|uniref:Protein kinase domain-containing protein n=1 Tax=Brassica cretica TaxID=69181 RepID=A0A8S9JP79_BRACR|nr:hypothetical protein F2Q70_00036420 [Brassica cretica]
MVGARLVFWRLGFLVLVWFPDVTTATLSPTGVNYEVTALVAIKSELNDPYNVLENWDVNSVDPCSWRMVTCTDGYVSALGLPSQSLSGTLSPRIGNLSYLQSVLLQNNAISGPIPDTIGRLEKLQTLDLSNNSFTGEIPASLGELNNLNYLRLNNNSLSGTCPQSLSKIEGLTLVDISYNNLSGSLPKVSARTFKDVKAANILLDEDFEAVVGDFGLAKLLDHRDSHVTTAVRGTVGHIAPEYLSTGQSSEKTDVFGFGILLLELITGQKALDFGRSSHQKGVMLDWIGLLVSIEERLHFSSVWSVYWSKSETCSTWQVKKLHQEGKLKQLIDKDLNDKYDRVELEEIVQVALLCTQFNPSNRPKMSEVMKMLEGDGLADRWEASQSGGAKSLPPPLPSGMVSSSPHVRYYSDYIQESSLVVEAIELSGPR